MSSTLRRITVAAAVCGGLLLGAGRAAAAGPTPNNPQMTGIGHPGAVPVASSSTFRVTNVDLTFETCEDRSIAWVCPFTATFTLARGTGGTVSWDILGTEVTCSGSSSAFERPQQDFTVRSNADMPGCRRRWSSRRASHRRGRGRPAPRPPSPRCTARTR